MMKAESETWGWPMFGLLLSSDGGDFHRRKLLGLSSRLKTVLLPIFDLNRVWGGGWGWHNCQVNSKSLRGSASRGFPRYPHFTLFPHSARFSHGNDIFWFLVLLFFFVFFFNTSLFFIPFKCFIASLVNMVFFVFLVHVIYMHLFFSSPPSHSYSFDLSSTPFAICLVLLQHCCDWSSNCFFFFHLVYFPFFCICTDGPQHQQQQQQ